MENCTVDVLGLIQTLILSGTLIYTVYSFTHKNRIDATKRAFEIIDSFGPEDKEKPKHKISNSTLGFYTMSQARRMFLGENIKASLIYANETDEVKKEIDRILYNIYHYEGKQEFIIGKIHYITLGIYDKETETNKFIIGKMIDDSHGQIIIEKAPYDSDRQIETIDKSTVLESICYDI